MGCDIHMYVEYKPSDESSWYSFGREINPGRDYDLFTAIAGVRGDARDAAVQARGLPDDLGYSANKDAFLSVLTADEADKYPEPPEGCCTAAQAKQWGMPLLTGKSGRQYIHQPDWHGHSWLTPTELELCLMRVKNEGSEASDEYYALLASMQELERRDNEVRVVFWFDN